MHRFKFSIHLMVDECTKTPQEISDRLKVNEELKNAFVKQFFDAENISYLTDENYNNAVKDIGVFMEKYLSINYPNKDIFTKDRYGYPVQMSATDSDFSSVDET